MELAALIISGVSLILSIVSFIMSTKSQHLQDRVNEMEIKLKEYELAEKEKEQQKISCIEARIQHVTKNNYKMKVWNSGNTIARNITASWDKSAGIIAFDHEKMPFEFLEPQKGFELSVSTYDNATAKICVTTEWEDESGEKHNKTQWCDF